MRWTGLMLAMVIACGAWRRADAATGDEAKLYRVGQAAFDDKIYDLAESQFAELLQKSPDSGRADSVYLLLGQAQLYQGKWAEAVKTLEGALTKWPTGKRPDSFRFWLAEALAKGEKFAEAETRYADLLEKFPRSPYRPQAEYGLAYAQFKQEKFAEAVQTVDGLLKLGLKGDLAEEAELLHGQLLLAQKDFAAAEAALDVVTKKYPDTIIAIRGHYWFGELLARENKPVDAIKHYTTITDSFKTKPGKPVDSQLAAQAWFGIGWVRWQQEKFADAAEAFTEALAHAKTPQLSRDALLKLAESNVRAGKVSDGVARMKSFVQTYPTDPIAETVQMQIGDLLAGQKDCAAAVAAYAEVATRFPQGKLVATANLRAGLCAQQMTKPADALTYFKQAVAAAKDDPALAATALFKAADLEFELRQFADAIASYQKLIGNYPDTKLLDRAMFQLGQAYQQIKNPEAAATAYDALVKQFPASEFAARAAFLVGSIRVELAQEEPARTAFGAVVTMFPKSEWAGQAALAVGESFYREAKFAEASVAYDKLIAVEPDSPLGQQATYQRGWCNAAQGRPEKTLADFSKFLAKSPQAAPAADMQFWIGDYYSKKKDYLKAQEQFQLVVQNYPKSRMADAAQYLAARAAYARQDYKAAIDSYELLLKGYPQSDWRCDARFGQGDALTELGQFDNALLVFESLIKEFPKCFLACEALGRKGDCQATLKRDEEAAGSYRAALECAPESDPALRNQLAYKLGQCFEKLGKLPEAFENYSKPVYVAAVAAPSDLPPERFWQCKAGLAAANVKEQQQKWAEAITIYTRLLGQCPDVKPLVEERIRKLRVEHLILF